MYIYLFLAIKFYLSFFTLYDIIYFIYKTLLNLLKRKVDYDKK